MKVIEDWSLENTEQACVFLLHLNGIGHLSFNSCLFEAVTSHNQQALHSRLLAQATTRGFKWYHQAQIYRWFAFRLTIATLLLSVAAILVTYWGTTQRREADKHRTSLDNLIVVGGNGSEQVNAAKTMAKFRQSKGDWYALKSF